MESLGVLNWHIALSFTPAQGLIEMKLIPLKTEGTVQL
jgi:hypothetical protein